MSLFVNCNKISKSFGPRALFHDLSFSILEKDRIGLIGPNGCGKSTLLKIILGEETPDAGQIACRRGLKIGFVPQFCDFSKSYPKDIILEVIAKESLVEPSQRERAAEMWLSKMGFDSHADTLACNLSGGWKKRLSITIALVGEPDVLLLDEPTNHLDLDGLLWLERFLAKTDLTYLIVSHDRYFLQNAARRVIEISKAYPGGYFMIDGPYNDFLEKKEVFLQGQIQQEKSVASKARREAEWLSNSPKARTCKSRARIEEAGKIMEELSSLRQRNRTRLAQIDFDASFRQTQKLIALNNVEKSIAGKKLFSHLDLTLSPGSRLGLIGPNGSGKTTLLRILAGQMAPDVGTVKPADDLKIVFFDQHRSNYVGTGTLKEALSPRGDYVQFRGQTIHVNGWCKRFLFAPDDLAMPVEKLSGGERARIAIARFLLQPADILLLDEPSNDLDIPTLETLEESLLDFPGAVVIISHDRCMLDRVCNSVLAMGSDQMTIFADYAQWEAAGRKMAKKIERIKEPVIKKGLSSDEKKECRQIERQIESLESKVKSLNSLSMLPENAQNSEKLSQLCAKVSLMQTQLEQLYLRWEILEQKALGLS